MRYEPLETYAETLRRFHHASLDHEEANARLRLESAWAAVDEQRQRRALQRWRIAALLRMTAAIDWVFIGISLSLLMTIWVKFPGLSDPLLTVAPGLITLGVWLLIFRRWREVDLAVPWLGRFHVSEKTEAVRPAWHRRRRLGSATRSQYYLREIADGIFFSVVPLGDDPLHRFRHTRNRQGEGRDIPLVCLSSMSQAIAHATAMERSGTWLCKEGEWCDPAASRARRPAITERQLVRIAIDRLSVLDARAVQPTRLPLGQLTTLARQGGAEGLVLPTLLSAEESLLAVLPEAIADHVRILGGEKIDLPVESECSPDPRPKWLSDDQTVAAILSEAMAADDFDSWLDCPNPYFAGETPRTVLTPQERTRFQSIATRQLHDGD